MKMRASARSGGGWWVMLLLALPFAVFGVVMLGVTVRLLAFAYATTTWDEVPASIVSTAISGHGGKSASSEARASYRYAVNGKTYTGYRVAIHGGSDNIGDFQRTAYEELKRYQDSGKPFRCFVNPHDPGDSILYRDPRWGLVLFKGMFGLVFGGVGFGLIAGMVWGRRQEAREAKSKAQHPDEPWLWNPDWGSGLIRSSSKGEMWVALVVAGLWNAISIPIAFHVLTDGHLAQERGRLAVLIFPLAGIGLGAWAFVAVTRYLKYGVSTLQLSKVPGVIGGPLAGVVQVPVHVVPEDGFRVALRCVHRYTTGSGKNRNTHETVLWEDERVLAHELCERDPTRSAIPVLFGIPRSCQPTRPEPADDQILWRLEVSAQTPGVDYASRFEVPVFVTPDSVADFRLDESLMSKYEKKIDAADVFKANHVRVDILAGRQVLVFPAARHKGMAFFLTLFAAAWTAIVVAMGKAGAPLFMTILFGLVDVAVLWGMLVVWLESRRMEIGAREVTLSGGILGVGRTHRVPCDKVADVVVASGMQSGNRSYFTLKLRTRGGRSLTIGARILGKHAADLLAGQIGKLVSAAAK